MIEISKTRKCSYLLPDPGGEVVRKLCDEIDRLRAALAPFADVAKGIPANWPADARLREDADCCGIERRFHLAYWPATCGSGLPTIGEWRAAANAAESE